jgi:hypothetical protein
MMICRCRELVANVLAVNCGANAPPTPSPRYHAVMEGRQERGNTGNTCCEGQGTRLFGSLPEYIYSHTSSGIMVNMCVSLRTESLALRSSAEVVKHLGCARVELIVILGRTFFLVVTSGHASPGSTVTMGIIGDPH